MENKFPGKNGIAGLFQGKTPLRKPNPQQAIVTPLRPGKKDHLRKKVLGRMVKHCIKSQRDLGNYLNVVSFGLLLVKWANSFHGECDTNDALYCFFFLIS